MKNEQLKHGQQEKMSRNFHQNFDLNVTAQEVDNLKVVWPRQILITKIEV